jgi:hypothetical protein
MEKNFTPYRLNAMLLAVTQFAQDIRLASQKLLAYDNFNIYQRGKWL